MAFSSSIALESTGGFTAVSTAAGVQTAPGAVALSTGNTAVFYISGSDLMAQLVNSSTGALVGGAVSVASGVDIPLSANGVPVATSVDVLSNGNIVVTWANNAGTKDAFFRIYDGALAPVTAALPAETFSSSASRPDVAALTGGGFAIAWEATFSATDHDINYRVFDNAGVAITVGGAVRGTSELDVTPSIAATATGFQIGFVADGASEIPATQSYSATGVAIGQISFGGTPGTINRGIQLVGNGSDTPFQVYEDSTAPGSTVNTDVTAVTPNGTIFTALSQSGNNGSLGVSRSADGFYLITSTQTFSATDFDTSLAIVFGASSTLLPVTPVGGSNAIDETGLTAVWTSPSSIRVFQNQDTGVAGDADAGIVTRGYNLVNIITGDNVADTLVFTIDRLNDRINAGGGDDVISSGFGTDTLNGEDGNDILTGWGLVTANGGNGNDSIILAYGALPVAIDGGAGTDTLTLDYADRATSISVNFSPLWSGGTLSFLGGTITGIEQLGTITGTNGNDTINVGANALAPTGAGVQGSIGDDLLVGGNNADKLDGGSDYDTLVGGAGDDTLTDPDFAEMIGGTGNDTYIVATRQTSIIEVADEGIDAVVTSTTVFVLPNNVETLSFAAGVTEVLGIGNALNNTIYGVANSRDELFGQDGDDYLIDGNGAPGTESTLIGGNGNDRYYVILRGHSTIELPGGGIDEVETPAGIYALQPNVENLTSTDNASHPALVGNVLDNVIRGGTGTDSLFGREGNDQLYGGTGNFNTLLGQEGDDIYHIETSGDTVLEFANQGTDTVHLYVPVFTLPTNVENLVYVGNDVGTAIGNASANMLTGGAGGDFLSGLDGNDILIGGGASDTLLGGTGSDQFRYLGNDGFDSIVGFQSGLDSFALSSAAYAHTATVDFVQGGAAAPTTANSTFLYNSASGLVSYDPDGTGAAAAIQLASIGVGLALQAGDFVFI